MTRRLRSLRPTEPQTERLFEFMTLFTLLIVVDVCDASSEITKTHGSPDRTFIGDMTLLTLLILEDVCDVSSEITKTHGAPDRTFI